MSHEPSLVTFCVPVYNAEAFLAETLDSVRRQTHTDYKVLVSIDRSTDRSAEVARGFLADRRFRLFVHRKRLGWAGNLNFLLAKVRSRYFCVLPHDDLLAPPYIRRLLEALAERPRAVAAHSDLHGFGEHEAVIHQEDLVGDRLTRVVAYLERHYPAVLFRALVDRKRLGGRVEFGSNAHRDFAEDTVWGLRLAVRGEVVRVPETLYEKRYHGASYHRDWQRWSDEQALDAWIHHCVRCFEVTREEGVFAEHPVAITRACLNRLWQSEAGLWLTDRLRPLAQDPESLARFVAGVGGRP